MHKNKFYKNILINLFKEAVRVADPSDIIADYLPKSPPKGRTVVIGAGKASAKMAKSFEHNWIKMAYGNIEGLVITRYGHGEKCRYIEVVEASHPVPDEKGLKATAKIIKLVSKLNSEDLLIFLVSGGGSALLTAPKKGVSFNEKQDITSALLVAGASISEINCVRKHLSIVKGGNLASIAYPASILTLAISDVPGDDPSIIASGPTFPDDTYSYEAKEIIKKYNIKCSNRVIDILGSSKAENPKSGDEVFSKATYKLIACPQRSLVSAAKLAKLNNYKPLILSDSIEGEANDVGIVHAAIAKQVLNYGQPGKPPLCILSGGETTVKINNFKGRGGRNSQFLLSLCISLNSEKNIYAIACDTDGIDGLESNAGSLIYPNTLERGIKLGMDAKDYLNRNDSYSYFSKLNDLVITGPTKTNVNDFRALIISN